LLLVSPRRTRWITVGDQVESSPSPCDVPPIRFPFKFSYRFFLFVLFSFQRSTPRRGRGGETRPPPLSETQTLFTPSNSENTDRQSDSAMLTQTHDDATYDKYTKPLLPHTDSVISIFIHIWIYYMIAATCVASGSSVPAKYYNFVLHFLDHNVARIYGKVYASTAQWTTDK